MLAATVVGLLRRSRASGDFGRAAACLAQLLDAPGAGPPSCSAGRPCTASSNACSPLENIAGDCSQADRAHHGVGPSRRYSSQGLAPHRADCTICYCPDRLPWSSGNVCVCGPAACSSAPSQNAAHVRATNNQATSQHKPGALGSPGVVGKAPAWPAQCKSGGKGRCTRHTAMGGLLRLSAGRWGCARAATAPATARRSQQTLGRCAKTAGKARTA